ncbi:MAG TPA: lysozyme inhibitor LprI family protein [Chthoniobacter sp.]
MTLRFSSFSLAKWLTVCAIIGLGGIGRGADPALPESARAKFPPGYCRFPGTISPDGAYAFAWAPDGLTAEETAVLKEWPHDLDLSSDDGDVDNFLFDVVHKRLLAQLPGFDFFVGQGWRKNRGELYVGWSPDSRHAVAISQERWDDDGIAWIDARANKVTSIKEALLKAFGSILRQRHKEKPDTVNMQFSDPVILANGQLVIDGNGGHMKEGPYYDYRLTCRVMLAEGKPPRVEVLKARMVSDERSTGVDYEPDLNLYYNRLRAKLDEKGKAALKKEEQDWLKFRDAQPEEAREQLTERRAVELRARCEH